MNRIIFTMSVLLIGCLNTTNHHPYRPNNETTHLAPVESSVAPTSSLVPAPCARCIEYEDELRGLRWLLDEPSEPDLSEPF